MTHLTRCTLLTAFAIATAGCTPDAPGEGDIASQDEVAVPQPQPGDGGPATGADAPVAPGTDTPDAPAPPPSEPAPGDDAPPVDEPPADDPPAVLDRIPESYVGRWDADAAACRRSTNEMRLVVTADRLRFYEGSSSVLGVRREDVGITVVADHQAEGTRSRRTYNLSLNEAGNRLKVITELSTATRVRCPAA